MSVVSLQLRNAEAQLTRDPVGRFLAFLETRKKASPETLKAYRLDLAQFQRWMAVDILKVERREIDFYLDNTLAKLADKSKSRKYASLKSFYKFCLYEGLIRNNPMDGVIPPKVQVGKPKPIGRSKLNKILKAIPPDRKQDKLLILLMLETGIRVSEALTLTVENIDWRKQQATIIGKGGKQRTVFLWHCPRALSLLKAHLKEKGIRAGYVFPGANGGHLHYRTINKWWVEYCKRAGVREVGLGVHSLRHQFADDLLEDDVELGIVSELLGHADPKTTRNYAAATDRRLARALKARQSSP